MLGGVDRWYLLLLTKHTQCRYMYMYMLVAWLTWSLCSGLWTLFLFAVFFLSLTIKLTFILDHACSFHFISLRQRTRYRSTCNLCFKWSQFGANWSIISEIHTASCKNGLFFPQPAFTSDVTIFTTVKSMWFPHVKLDKMPFKPARNIKVILSYKYVSFHILHLIFWFLGSSKFQLKINQDN